MLKSKKSYKLPHGRIQVLTIGEKTQTWNNTKISAWTLLSRTISPTISARVLGHYTYLRIGQNLKWEVSLQAHRNHSVKIPICCIALRTELTPDHQFLSYWTKENYLRFPFSFCSSLVTFITSFNQIFKTSRNMSWKNFFFLQKYIFLTYYRTNSVFIATYKMKIFTALTHCSSAARSELE